MTCVVLDEVAEWACYLNCERKDTVGTNTDQPDVMTSAAIRAMGGGVCIGR